jgi:hypothetical protein
MIIIMIIMIILESISSEISWSPFLSFYLRVGRTRAERLDSEKPGVEVPEVPAAGHGVPSSSGVHHILVLSFHLPYEIPSFAQLFIILKKNGPIASPWGSCSRPWSPL